MQGQSQIFELVLLFSISVGIFIVLFVVINTYQEYYSTVAVRDQINSVSSLIASAITELSVKDGNGSISLDIPRKAGDRLYGIVLDSNGLNVSTADSEYFSFSPLYWINETFTLEGGAVSSEGKIVINKRGNKINII